MNIQSVTIVTDEGKIVTTDGTHGFTEVPFPEGAQLVVNNLPDEVVATEGAGSATLTEAVATPTESVSL